MKKKRVKVKLLSHVRLCNHTYCSLAGSSIHGIFQARILEWVAISFSRGSGEEVFPTQGQNPGIPHCTQMLCHLSQLMKREIMWAGGDKQLGPLIGSPGHEVLHREDEPHWGCRKPVLHS